MCCTPEHDDSGTGVALVLAMSGAFLLGVVGVAARFAVGLPLTGRRTTDATFFRGAVPPPESRPPWFGVELAWAYRSGLFRATARWAVVAVAVLVFVDPILTTTVVTAAVTVGAMALGRHHQRSRSTRPVVLTGDVDPVLRQLEANTVTWSDLQHEADKRGEQAR
jgi:hypothetical protein